MPASQDTAAFSGLTAATAYEAELCVVCPDGTLNCALTTFNTLAENSDCGPLPTPAAIPITEEAVSLTWPLNALAASYRITWSTIIVPPTTAPIRRQSRNRRERAPRGRIRPGTLTEPSTRVLAPSSVGTAPTADTLLLPGTATDAVIDGLTPGTDYAISLCQICPDGTEACFNWTLDFNGIDDDCLTNLLFTRPDSTETTLDLAWTYNPTTVSATDSFQLIWQLSDLSLPANMVTLAYADSSYTIANRIPGQTYTLRVCTECTLGQPVCKDLPPFGGCPADYTPILVDLDFKRALIGWEVPEPPMETTELRYAMRSFANWETIPTDQFEDFNPLNHPLPGAQMGETPKLNPTLVYLAQVRNRCYDSLWSAWSEPIAFSTGCAVTDELQAEAITDVSAQITSPPRPNASYYQFYYQLVDSVAGDWTLLDNVPTSQVSLENLLSDTLYQVRMRFWCNQGVWSDFTGTLTFRTLPPCGTPTDGLASEILATAAGLVWTPGENAVTTTLQYRQVLPSLQIEAAPISMEREQGGRGGGGRIPIGGTGYGNQNTPWQTVENLTDSIFLTDLEGGGRYEFRLQSDCDVNLSEWSDIEEFTLLCAPPDQVSVSDINYESALVTISGLSPTAGQHEYSYRILGDSVWQSLTRSAASVLLENLNDLSIYELRVRTRCDAGQFS
ncbi:MAG: hypothetical protein AAF840_12305, partial [Bacteroidota bacterium]